MILIFSHYQTPVKLIGKLLLYLKFLVLFSSLRCNIVRFFQLMDYHILKTFAYLSNLIFTEIFSENVYVPAWESQLCFTA